MAATASSSPLAANTVQPYRMRVSQRYLDLTRQKLELTRFPREPQGTGHTTLGLGVSKAELEPLIDHWLERYSWRDQETFYNDELPQFRAALNGTRLHFVHRRSDDLDAIPLLFVHGVPESFIAVAPMIEALCRPISTPPRGTEEVQAFHVIVPSIPGFGFSDALIEDGNVMNTTAATFDALMKMLGYHRYIAHGSGWGFRICRLLALGFSDSCVAVHTVNPDVPPPRSSFGYIAEEMALSGLTIQSPGAPGNITPGLTPPVAPVQPSPFGDRPQTLAYALCDSPAGLLAWILDAIQPPRSATIAPPSPIAVGLQPAMQTPMLSSQPSPQSAGPSSAGRSPPSLQALELETLNEPWSAAALITWTMIYWLPGPEVSMRWLVNSTKVLPSLWQTHSPVPLGITHFRDPAGSVSATGQTPPEWAEAYHTVAMVTRREGRVRFPAWERPGDVVTDLRKFAEVVGVLFGIGGEREMVV